MELERMDSERVARFLKLRLGEQAWSVDEAKAKLTKIMKEAKSGQPQLVGLRKPVVMISVDELEELVTGLQQPENWGEYFATAHDGGIDNFDIPLRHSGGRARYQLDISQFESAEESVDAGVMDEDIDGELELAAAYIDMGDPDAAHVLVNDARERVRVRQFGKAADRQRIMKIYGLIPLEEHPKDDITSFLRSHAHGTQVEGEIVQIAPKRVFVKFANGMTGVAYTTKADALGFVKGQQVKACVVGNRPTRDGIALSIRDAKTGVFIKDGLMNAPEAK